MKEEYIKTLEAIVANGGCEDLIYSRCIHCPFNDFGCDVEEEIIVKFSQKLLDIIA